MESQLSGLTSDDVTKYLESKRGTSCLEELQAGNNIAIVSDIFADREVVMAVILAENYSEMERQKRALMDKHLKSIASTISKTKAVVIWRKDTIDEIYAIQKDNNYIGRCGTQHYHIRPETDSVILFTHIPSEDDLAKLTEHFKNLDKSYRQMGTMMIPCVQYEYNHTVVVMEELSDMGKVRFWKEYYDALRNCRRDMVYIGDE